MFIALTYLPRYNPWLFPVARILHSHYSSPGFVPHLLGCTRQCWSQALIWYQACATSNMWIIQIWRNLITWIIDIDAFPTFIWCFSAQHGCKAWVVLVELAGYAVQTGMLFSSPPKPSSELETSLALLIWQNLINRGFILKDMLIICISSFMLYSSSR